jgi:hypothetical protein
MKSCSLGFTFNHRRLVMLVPPLKSKPAIRGDRAEVQAKVAPMSILAAIRCSALYGGSFASSYAA